MMPPFLWPLIIWQAWLDALSPPRVVRRDGNVIRVRFGHGP
jgi:hypothetical protein